MASPPAALGLILLATAATRLAWLNSPDRALVFDETYYVNAARRILGWSVATGAPYADAPAGIDPNGEHPPLGKVLIAASMRAFGDNPIGWRFPSLVAGLVVVLAVYLLVRSTARDPWLAVYAAGVVMLDNLLLVHSRIAMLDILFVAPLMVGAVLVLRRHWWWAGVACGLAIVVKVPAVFGLLALVVVVLVLPGGPRFVERVRNAVILGGVSLVVATAGLWFLDVRFTTFDNPYAHMLHISSYGLDLSHPGGPVNGESDPWQWLSNDVQITYLRVDTNEEADGKIITTKPLVFFRGGMNPALAGVAVLSLCYAAWAWIRRRDPLACWSVVWFAGLFLPFVVLSLVAQRVTYFFYALPLVPTYAVAATLMLWHPGFPRVCRWGFAAALILGFLAYFPFREFLQ